MLQVRVVCLTWYDLAKLYDGDESFAAVTGREHEDNREENGGDEDVPLYPVGGINKRTFPPDGDVDPEVEDQQREEIGEVDRDGDQVTDLNNAQCADCHVSGLTSLTLAYVW